MYVILVLEYCIPLVKYTNVKKSYLYETVSGIRYRKHLSVSSNNSSCPEEMKENSRHIVVPYMRHVSHNMAALGGEMPLAPLLTIW